MTELASIFMIEMIVFDRDQTKPKNQKICLQNGKMLEELSIV